MSMMCMLQSPACAACSYQQCLHSCWHTVQAGNCMPAAGPVVSSDAVTGAGWLRGEVAEGCTAAGGHSADQPVAGCGGRCGHSASLRQGLSLFHATFGVQPVTRYACQVRRCPLHTPCCQWPLQFAGCCDLIIATGQLLWPQAGAGI